MTTRASAPTDGAAVAFAAALAGPGAGAAYASLKKGLRDVVARDPFDAMIGMVAGGAFLFYLAEVGRNPKVRSYWDALVFISTCASVGYADVFARTPTGKALATAVMTFGPALSGAIFEEPGGRQALSPEALALHRVIVDKLDVILSGLPRA
jgi:hypothetical protein